MEFLIKIASAFFISLIAIKVMDYASKFKNFFCFILFFVSLFLFPILAGVFSAVWFGVLLFAVLLHTYFGNDSLQAEWQKSSFQRRYGNVINWITNGFFVYSIVLLLKEIYVWFQ